MSEVERFIITVTVTTPRDLLNQPVSTHWPLSTRTEEVDAQGGRDGPETKE